ncbi:hypothetical protein [Clostridium sp. HBUAS56010]|uniref:hypothetical protein n=1 Tax=Clostridium sp. HBUAS56010 TaxID=2571127 RepID=UPI001178264F|nr:hypothetical protein [Clostridium sp. HBUAS56010]
MSKIFHISGLETNAGILDAGIMSGIPEVEDIQRSNLYQELTWDCGASECIAVIVKSFRYGHGPPEPADAEDLSWIALHREMIETGEAIELHPSRFAIFYPDHGM